MQVNIGLVLFLPGTEATSSLVCPGSQEAVHYREMEKKRLALFTKMVGVETLAKSVSRGHDNLQYTAGEEPETERKSCDITPMKYRKGLN